MKNALIKGWIGFISLRYLFTRRKEKGHVASLLSVLGITVGVTTLVIVLSVMNGFQHNYIDNINEVISYHLRIDASGGTLSAGDQEKILAVRNVTALVPFVDLQTTVKGEFGDSTIALIRGVPADLRSLDPVLAEHLSIESGQFDIGRPGTLVLGSELAMNQGIFPGDKVTLLSLAGDKLSRLTLQEREFEVTGTVKTGYKEYDKTLGFISLESARDIMNENYIIYGVKTRNVNRAETSLEPLAKALGNREDIKLSSWKNYNVSFFEALRMEKTMMFMVVSLVFLVVAVNIFHSLKRSVSERMEEIALLKSLGAVPGEIKLIFLTEGLLLSLTGVTAGLLLGVLLSLNINGLFRFIEWVVNGLLTLSGSGEIALYSSRNFYLADVPVLIMSSDMIFIGLAAVLLSLGGAWLAAAPVAQINPAEVLNIE